MTVKELALRLHIEEDNRNAGVVSALPGPSVGEVKHNVVKQGSSSKKGKRGNFAPRRPYFKRNGHNSMGDTFKKFEGLCYNYNRRGHKSYEWKQPKKCTNNSGQGNMVNIVTEDFSGVNISDVISEVNLVGTNPQEWWIDTGETRHVCSVKEQFTTYKKITNGKKMYVENSTTSTIEGEGSVVLKMTSGNQVTLNKVQLLEINEN
ncbi:hypothetical protein LIER_36293 [Lithospermum erythrorhizon]|uniref:Retrovirus-related Pol polyprotein from transposon TNT 1-94-like beta-barrel domain-containing protein n=1 Tax=Lithospermum erythrorhizon TaxID=34254 RepID=A0AAV3P4R6_LITER